MAAKIGWVLLGVIVIVIGAVVVLTLLAEPSSPHPFFTEGPPRPWVIAHQGGDGLWPGDTLFAFEQAVDSGVDVLEMDLHQTADGVLVLMHDSTVDRTTDGSGEIKGLAFSEIKELDAGYDWSADGGSTFPFRGMGITVPSLEEVFQSFPGAHMNIEIKQVEPSIGAAFCSLIRQFNMQNRVLVASFHTAAMQDFRQACPEVATSGTRSELTVQYALTTLFLGSTLTPDYEAVQAPEYSSGLKVLSPRFVNTAHQRGLEVHPWTINETSDIQRFLEMGVDGIITDRPDRMLELLGR
jgi:glycerophosphoryl diester phosphodiesterase